VSSNVCSWTVRPCIGRLLSRTIRPVNDTSLNDMLLKGRTVQETCCPRDALSKWDAVSKARIVQETHCPITNLGTYRSGIYLHGILDRGKSKRHFVIWLLALISRICRRLYRIWSAYTTDFLFISLCSRMCNMFYSQNVLKFNLNTARFFSKTEQNANKSDNISSYLVIYLCIHRHCQNSKGANVLQTFHKRSDI
jgi:hypothetical protein